jgi:pimeloyl-ACP methyl ester carboxylesterase
MSLWKHSNEDGERLGEQSEESLHEPNERSSLLSRNQRHLQSPNRDGYLDPDDPAVSPYNLWTVRFVRYLTVLFFLVTFVWWILLLTSIFVSPPGMHTRGSGFFDFSYTCLTVGNLIVALLFFSAPSKAMRILSGVIAVLLLIQVIIITAVDKLRWEEGWVGVVSVVWAFVMAAWCIFADRIVAWGKREEEERLTGRAETRRTAKEWFEVFTATIILTAFIVITFLLFGSIIIRASDASLKMDGQRYLVDGDKYSVHFACSGNVSYNKAGKKLPTVLLESGEHPSEFEFEKWAYGSWSNGTISRYCYWDRPGYAFSDNAPSPHSAGMSATALAEVLAVTGEEGPWILVSAGYGSIVSRIFASMHMKDVVGMLLVDPLHEDLLHRIGSARRGFVTWGWGIISPLGLGRLPGVLFNGRGREDRIFGIDAEQSGKMLKARLQEHLVADSLTKNEILSARVILEKGIPLAVVSSGVQVGRSREWAQKQQDLTTITDHLISWTVVKKAPHEVWKTYEGREAIEKALQKLIKATPLPWSHE